MELLVAFLCGALLLLLNQRIFAHLIHPTQAGILPVFAVVPAGGDGQGLEQTLRHLQWLRQEKLSCFTILVVDAGLTQEGLETVAALKRKEASLLFCSAGEATLILKRKDDHGYFSL